MSGLQTNWEGVNQLDPSRNNYPLSLNVPVCPPAQNVSFLRAGKGKSVKLLVLVTRKVRSTHIFYLLSEITPDISQGGAILKIADNGSISQSPSPESSPTKHGTSDESPFIRPSSPTQPSSQLTVSTLQGDASASVLQITSQLRLTSSSLRCAQAPRPSSKPCKPFHW